MAKCLEKLLGLLISLYSSNKGTTYSTVTPHWYLLLAWLHCCQVSPTLFSLGGEMGRACAQVKLRRLWLHFEWWVTLLHCSEEIPHSGQAFCSVMPELKGQHHYFHLIGFFRTGWAGCISNLSCKVLVEETPNLNALNIYQKRHDAQNS